MYNVMLQENKGVELKNVIKVEKCCCVVLYVKTVRDREVMGT